MDEFKAYGDPWHATNTSICRSCGSLVPGLKEYQELHLEWHRELEITEREARIAYNDWF